MMGPSDAARVAVAGATGATGRRVVARLQRRGIRPIVLARDADRARRLLGDVETVVGDVRDRASLTPLERQLDIVISAVGTRTYIGSNGGAAVDAIGTRNLVAATAGTAHFVLLSAFGLDRQSPFLTAFSLMFNRYLHWKAEAEAAVRAGAAPYTIVRPVELRDRPTRGRPLLNQAAPLSLLRTVSRDLVADVLVAVSGDPRAHGLTFELCETPYARSIEDQLGQLRRESDRPRPAGSPLW